MAGPIEVLGDCDLKFGARSIEFLPMSDEEYNHSETDGFFCPKTGVIKLKPQSDEFLEHLVFWHEIFHAIYDQAGLFHPEGSDEEDIVNRFAATFLAVVSDNPMLLTVLTAYVEKMAERHPR